MSEVPLYRLPEMEHTMRAPYGHVRVMRVDSPPHGLKRIVSTLFPRADRVMQPSPRLEVMGRK